MKRFISLSLMLGLAALILALTTENAFAQSSGLKKGNAGTTQGLKWGSFDDDGDGILNCQDPDYVRPQDGTGKQLGKTAAKGGKFGKAGSGMGNCGALNGTGTGVCDGTGPKGKGRTK
jgi:hypothetical protein